MPAKTERPPTHSSERSNDDSEFETDYVNSYASLDKLLEHRSRFAICALLKRYDKVAFRRFKELLKESDGNLGAQLRKLEDAGYVSVNKEFENRRPVSWYSITDLGRNALATHLNALEAMLAD